ncbi:NAD(P)-binding protein [Lichtheimia hyalospora FSU 10163]|nr:NAD(P)-binding protein [Lichtheimia hyalospora FSU 10163]
MNTTTPQCAFIGLGAMGIHMAKHIHNHLVQLNYPPLLVYNRTRARSDALASDVPGIQVVESLQQVAQTADVIFTCLLNDTAVTQVITDLIAAGVKQDAIIVEQSTIAPNVSKDLATKVKKESKAHFIACPIMGPPPKAAAAQLIVLAAGPQDVRNKVLPLLVPAIGPKAIELGDDSTQALHMKLTGNFFITSLVEMLGEGMTLGQAAGVGQDKVKELLDALFPGTLLPQYADRMLRNTYKDQMFFPLSSARKDATHIKNLGNNVNAKLPITDIFLNHLNSVQESEGDLDISGVVVASRKAAGLNEDGSKP